MFLLSPVLCKPSIHRVQRLNYSIASWSVDQWLVVLRCLVLWWFGGGLEVIHCQGYQQTVCCG